MRWYYWPLFALIMGFALGVNIVEAFVQPIEQTEQANPNQPTNKPVPSVTADERIADYTRTLDILTGVLAVATIGLLIAAAYGIFQTSRETKIVQRAYLAVDPLGVDPFGPTDPEISNSGPSVANIAVRNVGNLPARNVSWFINVRLDKDWKSKRFPINNRKRYGDNVVAPGISMARSQNKKFSREEYRAFKANILQLYVWGEVLYDDGFGVQRFTKFCHRYNLRSMKNVPVTISHLEPLPPLLAEGARYHRYGNDAD